ncbi:MAG: hypothetical protein H9847_05260 [Candidatus Anaerobiospirillum pullicola]|uniref:Uncharacterized protein n=1 Tax=Candidatus Anaerobiospirillum pullicola TaxID=2838451 RepID=A0A948TG79_9GAMM|nr:hypothetical protein [Candidatus Anaerobiospirillum pullicola]
MEAEPNPQTAELVALLTEKVELLSEKVSLQNDQVSRITDQVSMLLEALYKLSDAAEKKAVRTDVTSLLSLVSEPVSAMGAMLVSFGSYLWTTVDSLPLREWLVIMALLLLILFAIVSL